MVDSVFKLTRDQIVQFAKTPQQVRFFENLQSTVSTLPDDLISIYAAIQDSAVNADIALSSAMALLVDLRESIDETITFPIPAPPQQEAIQLFDVPAAPIVNVPDSFPLGNFPSTGWATYRDTVYTSGAPLLIASGATVTLSNNAGTIFNRYLPNNSAEFYNSGTQKIVSSNAGDYLIIVINFTLVPAAGTVNYLDFAIDVGGTLIAKRTVTLPKGAAAIHDVSIVCPLGINDSFVTNGGLIKITAGASNLSVYNIEYQIARTIENANS